MLDTTMRFWFVHSGEVSLREQLVTQITLGIAGGDLKPGERLPSTRAMAQRYGIHANTVSAAYKELEQLGRVESRKGSGVYIRTNSDTRTPAKQSLNLDRDMRNFLQAMRASGFSDDNLRTTFDRCISAAEMQSYTLIEPDDALARIVLRELEDLGISDTTWCKPEDISAYNPPTGKLLVLPSKLASTRALLPDHAVIALTINSVPQSLLAQGNIPSDALIGIASHWHGFLQIAQTMLLARGVSADAMLVRDANEAGWREGLEACAAVICDAITVCALPKATHTIPFRLLAEDTVSSFC